ncbi:MAG: hypothetical protein K8S87_11395 [Planctomycetes bacterium]|nr:hypothetical protein [Planctomycetota bacterium]
MTDAQDKTPEAWLKEISDKTGSITGEIDTNLVKINGTAISTDNPLPTKDKSYNESTEKNKVELEGALTLEKGTEYKFHDAATVNSSGNTADYTACRNFKKFIFAIKATYDSGTPEMTFTLMEKVDDFSEEKTVKDIAGNDITQAFSHASGTIEAFFKIDTDSMLTGVLENLFIKVSHTAGAYLVTSVIKPYR